MKIGLLTFHSSNNYGALLQTYATVQVLSKMGHECEIINLRRRPQNYFISYLYNQVCNRGFNSFRKQFLKPITKPFYEGKDLPSLNSIYDCFLVGSDQVWRPSYTGSLTTHYFLDFANDEKLKISYGSSFGISTWSAPPELTNHVNYLLQRFDAISVRESSGVNICQSNFGINAELVLDPTLLLTGEDYIKLLNDCQPSITKEFASIFLLDDNLNILEKHISKTMKSLYSIDSFSLSIPKITCGKYTLDWQPHDVLYWLKILKNTDIIFTDSFHCVVFAIIFHKKFICIANHKRGKARLESLLNMLGLSHLLIEKDDFTPDNLATLVANSIDYEHVNSVIKTERNRSLRYLANSLTSYN